MLDGAREGVLLALFQFSRLQDNSGTIAKWLQKTDTNRSNKRRDDKRQYSFDILKIKQITKMSSFFVIWERH